jgi:hypothetical protein
MHLHKPLPPWEKRGISPLLLDWAQGSLAGGRVIQVCLQNGLAKISPELWSIFIDILIPFLYVQPIRE